MTSKTDTPGSKCARRPLLVHNGGVEMNRFIFQSHRQRSQIENWNAIVAINVLFVHVASVDLGYINYLRNLNFRSADVSNAKTTK
jgi:hypothetical protein